MKTFVALALATLAFPATAFAGAMDCPSGFNLEAPTVFSSNQRSRLTGGKVKNGKVCLRVNRPQNGCGTFDTEFVHVFSAAHLGRLTGNGSKIAAGRACLGIQTPGSSVWDPIDPNAGQKTMRIRSKAMHRATNGNGSPYRTIANTSRIGCQGQCQIRSKCTEYDYNTETRQCRLWERASYRRPFYDPDWVVGLKSPKSAVKVPPAPSAAAQFLRNSRRSVSQASPFKTTSVTSVEICAQRCLAEPHRRCRTFSVGPSGSLKQCKLYQQNGTLTSISGPLRDQFVVGRYRGISSDSGSN